MKPKIFFIAEQNGDAVHWHWPALLHQITGTILNKYSDNRGNSAYLVQQKSENETPLISVECVLYQNGVYQHYFLTHTINDDPVHLPHYLNKALLRTKE